MRPVRRARAALYRQRFTLTGAAALAVLVSGVAGMTTRLDAHVRPAAATTPSAVDVQPSPVPPAPPVDPGGAGGGGGGSGSLPPGVADDLQSHLLVPSSRFEQLPVTGDGDGPLTLDDIQSMIPPQEYQAIVQCGGVAGYRAFWMDTEGTDASPAGLIATIYRFTTNEGAQCYGGAMRALLGGHFPTVPLPQAPPGTTGFHATQPQVDADGLVTYVAGGPYAVELIDFRSQGAVSAAELGADVTDQQRILTEDPPTVPAPTGVTPSGGTTA